MLVELIGPPGAGKSTLLEEVEAGDPVLSRFNREASATRRAEFPKWLVRHRMLVDLLPRDLERERLDGHGPVDAVRAAFAAMIERRTAAPRKSPRVVARGGVRLDQPSAAAATAAGAATSAGALRSR